jgi:hypothetical protein
MIIERFEPGTPVCAYYMGAAYLGKVIDSRVKYGGKLQYSVMLEKPTLVAGRTEETEDILVNHENILAADVNGRPYVSEYSLT